MPTFRYEDYFSRSTVTGLTPWIPQTLIEQEPPIKIISDEAAEITRLKLYVTELEQWIEELKRCP